MAEVDIDDDRWEGKVPWFLRHSKIEGQGDFENFFNLTARRVQQFFQYDEIQFRRNSLNLNDNGKRYLCSQVKSQTFCIYSFDEEFPTEVILNALSDFFRFGSMKRRAIGKLQQSDSHKLKLTKSQPGSTIDGIPREQYIATHLGPFEEEALKEGIFVLEVFLQLVKEKNINVDMFSSLKSDLRSYLAVSRVMLDIQENPILITPIDEPLFQEEVLGKLLPRLQLKFPQEANSLVEAYHQLLTETDSNKIFGDAYKALEVVARNISSTPNLLLSKHEQVRKAFPDLHETTIKNIVNLAAHTGDEGRHGGKAPPINQMRYLLLHICNVALLLLETCDAN